MRSEVHWFKAIMTMMSFFFFEYINKSDLNHLIWHNLNAMKRQLTTIHVTCILMNRLQGHTKLNKISLSLIRQFIPWNFNFTIKYHKTLTCQQRLDNWLKGKKNIVGKGWEQGDEVILTAVLIEAMTWILPVVTQRERVHLGVVIIASCWHCWWCIPTR